MFNIDSTELLFVAFVALVVIGPKDLPKAMRVVGYWVGRARGVARQFRSGFDQMVREAELEEMEKRWAAENARIMAEHPQVDPVPETSGPAASHDATGDRSAASTGGDDPDEMKPVMVEKPEIVPAATIADEGTDGEADRAGRTGKAIS